MLPPLTLLLGQMLPVFYTVGARISTVLLPPTLLLGQMLPVFYTVGVLGDPSLCYPPTPRLIAACFGAMSVGVLDNPSLCYPPTLHIG